MKMYPILLLSVLSATALLAQEETLVGEGFHSGGYGGPVWKVGSLKGTTGLFAGGRGAWIINHTIALGGGAYSVINDIESDVLDADMNPLILELEFGGFEIEYIRESDKLLHWTIHAMFGGGTARLRGENSNQEFESDNLYMFEPSFNMDLNVSRWFRIGFGVSYRLAMGLELTDVTASDVSGPSGLIILKFGSF